MQERHWYGLATLVQLVAIAAMGGAHAEPWALHQGLAFLVLMFVGFGLPACRWVELTLEELDRKDRERTRRLLDLQADAIKAKQRIEWHSHRVSRDI